MSFQINQDKQGMLNPRSSSQSAPLRLLLTLTAPLVVGACFTYQPVESTAPVLGEDVRVELTGAGQDNLMARRALDVEHLSGLAVGGGQGDLLLRVRLDPERLGYGTETVTDTVRVPLADVRSLGVRELSTGRTVLGITGAIVATAGVFALFQATQSSSGGDGDGGGTVFTVIPLSAILNAVTGGR